MSALASPNASALPQICFFKQLSQLTPFQRLDGLYRSPAVMADIRSFEKSALLQQDFLGFPVRLERYSLLTRFRCILLIPAGSAVQIPVRIRFNRTLRTFDCIFSNGDSFERVNQCKSASHQAELARCLCEMTYRRTLRSTAVPSRSGPNTSGMVATGTKPFFP